jgi:hypothetical protein
LSAVLGAICAQFDNERIRFINLSSTLEKELHRNQYLSYIDNSVDQFFDDDVITYRKFTPYADIEFIEYIRTELLSKPDFPKHSNLLGKKINESIFEVFENARTHGHCKHIFTCGQYYPQKTIKKLDMTIVDMGKTIKTNVNEYLKTVLSGSETITWALEYGNTTKTGTVSGGLGLDIIMEFIKLNKGKVQIVSSDGYWEFSKGKKITRLFKHSFPGTIFNIEFNLDDQDFYYLKEEISLDDIF